GIHFDQADAIFDHLLRRGRDSHSLPRDNDLLWFSAASPDDRNRDIRAGLTGKHIVNLGERHFTRALPFYGFHDVRALQARFVGGTARDDRDYRRVAEALRDSCADVGLGVSLVLFVFLVLRGTQVAAVGIKRLKQPMQRPVGYGGDIGFLHILAANAGKHLAVDLELAISAIVVGSVNTAEPESHEQHNG